MSFVKSNWKVLLVAGAVLMSFLLNDSLWNTLSHKRLIRDAQAELNSVNHDIDKIKVDLSDVKNNPRMKEHLVRTELGYLKPGEKEVRFNKNP